MNREIAKELGKHLEENGLCEKPTQIGSNGSIGIVFFETPKSTDIESKTTEYLEQRGINVEMVRGLPGRYDLSHPEYGNKRLGIDNQTIMFTESLF